MPTCCHSDGLSIIMMTVYILILCLLQYTVSVMFGYGNKTIELSKWQKSLAHCNSLNLVLGVFLNMCKKGNDVNELFKKLRHLGMPYGKLLCCLL